MCVQNRFFLLCHFQTELRFLFICQICFLKAFQNLLRLHPFFEPFHDDFGRPDSRERPPRKGPTGIFRKKLIKETAHDTSGILMIPVVTGNLLQHFFPAGIRKQSPNLLFLLKNKRKETDCRTFLLFFRQQAFLFPFFFCDFYYFFSFEKRKGCRPYVIIIFPITLK